MAPTQLLEAIPVSPTTPALGESNHHQKSQASNKIPLADIALLSSGRESESMVLTRRPSLHHRGLGHGACYDTRSGLPIFGLSQTEIRFDHDLGYHG